MKIISLTAENVKRLKAVDITPDEHLQIIGGRNSQGKTSVMDAIWLALTGGVASKAVAKPIRDGESKASVRLDLGDLIVTRTWAGEKTALTVASAEGAKFTSPQGVLDALIGRLSFDPLEFTHLSDRAQLAALLDLVDLDVDLDALAAERTKIFDDRTEIGREGKSLAGQATGLGKVEDAPDAEVSASDFIAQIRAAQDQERRYADDRRDLAATESAIEDTKAKIAALTVSLKEDEADCENLVAFVTAHAPVADVADLEQQLTAVEDTNAAVRRNTQRADVEAQVIAARKRHAAATKAIDDIDRTKADALAAATFPVPGLGFDDDGVTFEGIPFSQASSAEQIRVSLAMAMSLNPKLRVIRILDGSLLDTDNLALIAEMAKDQDFQIWIERVGSADGIGVVIEDGQVA